MMVSTVGYPSRPTGGGKLPPKDEFKLLSNEIATPKLDGHRVLYCCHTQQFYNRHCELYSYMDDSIKYDIQQLLQPVVNVDWVDMEYMHAGVNKGKFAIIDVIESGIRYRNYHERRELYAPYFPTCTVRSCINLETNHERNLGILKEGTKFTKLGLEFKERVENTPFDGPYQGYIFPVARTARDVCRMYGSMRESESALELYNDIMDKDHKGIWEGVVVKDASAPYKLMRRQSQNMHMETKYRFK